MKKLTPIFITLILPLFLLYACQFLEQGEKTTPLPDPNHKVNAESAAIGLANPSSVYCEKMGYELIMRDTDQGTHGICVLPGGVECEEWDFLAGRCGNEHSYCAKNGYILKAIENSNIGICQFPDGASCPEFEYLNGDCQP